MHTLDWKLQLTALSSIAHAGETRGTITLLRREQLRTPDGRTIHLPLISGNSWRGRLRRHAEELLRDELHYEGELHPAAAHALRGGGALAKTSHEPLSGARLQQLRNLVPLISIFGAAGGGTIIDGALQVGKIIPHVTETTHIAGVKSASSAFKITQLEAYARQDDTGRHDFADVLPSDAQLNLDPDTGIPNPTAGSNRLQFHIETFLAGTTFSSWLRLRRPSDLEAAFFVDVLDDFAHHGHLGGRSGVGHGDVHLTVQQAPELPPLPDWRDHCRTHRDEILSALALLA